jgi:hypothetical protein
MTIEVFKTDVADESQAKKLRQLLLQHFPSTRINFDLDDCDKVLRVEGVGFKTVDVIRLASKNGVVCKVLD